MSEEHEYLNQLEASIEGHRQTRDIGKAIERLRNNVDFKRVVLSGYLEQEAIRLVQARTDPSMQTDRQQADLIRQMDGIACFRDYLRVQLMLADRADGAIEEAEELRTQLLQEDLA
ncbi:MAG TPA: hypothetical protein VIG24_11980 [Acidimicrobiia bacterium]